MKHRTWASVAAATILFAWFTAACAGAPPTVVSLGDFALESGKTLNDCRIAYRTMGTLNPQGSNAVLVTTWLAGTSQEMIDLGFVGPGKAVNTDRFYAIIVDALGNGVSSSPSNSKAQPGAAFPAFTTADLVRTQYELLKKLGIKHLYAVTGISMGGFQTFEWMTEHPEFLDRAVPILGSPRPTTYDLLLGQSQLRAVENARKGGLDNITTMKAVGDIFLTVSYTPRYYAANVPPEGFNDYLKTGEDRLTKYDAGNWAVQYGALMSHDIFKRFGGSAEKAAAAIKAKTLVVTSAQDMIIYPAPAREFAAILKAETFELTGDCGHFAFICETPKVTEAVKAFLEKP